MRRWQDGAAWIGALPSTLRGALGGAGRPKGAHAPGARLLMSQYVPGCERVRGFSTDLRTRPRRDA